jgi:carbon storage regulator
MLVLSRTEGEGVVVPHLHLAITVLGIKGKAVRLGISAPEHLAVYREEVWVRVGENRRREKKNSLIEKETRP